MRRRALRAALVLVVALAGAAYAGLEKRVTVRIEGHPRAVRTFAFTVGDALRRAGIDVGREDRVVPGPGSRVDDGAVIDVLRAKPIVLLLDGKPRRVIVTGLTVDEVVREMEIRRSSLADMVRPSRAARVRPGMTIVYRRAVGVTVSYDGKRVRVVTNARTVRKVLRELGVRLGRRDKILPSADAQPRDAMTIRVLRVGFVREIVEQRLLFHSVSRPDPHLEYGLRRTTPGRAGLRRLVYRSKYVDGRRVSRRLLKVVTVRPVVNKTLWRGAWFPHCDCDDGTDAGDATWYRVRGLSAAHRTLPIGTVVRVTNLDNGKSVNVIVRDRGPYADGRIIDLSHHAFRLLAPLDKGVLNVRIRW